MRRVSLFLTTLVLAALLLAACGGQETSTSVPSTNVPPVTMESTSTEEATATEAATSAPEATTSPAVPVTGDNSPSRASNLIGTSVCGMGGDQLGTVQDLVVDFDQTMVTYVLVDANGRNIAVPWTSFDMNSMGGTGTGMDASCLTLTVDNDTFNNAPDFDSSSLPTRGQSAAGWDTSISGYWANPGAGTGTGTGSETSTPEAGGTSATAVPTTTSSTGTGTETGTATATAGTGDTGTGTGTGAMQMQGVMLATDILGATVTVSPQGNDQGTGTGTGAETSTPEAGVVSTNTPSASGDTTGTATPESSTGTGTGTGDFSTGTVEDMIVEPQTGDIQYLVISFGTEERWIPIPIGFLRWDSTTNGFVLMVNQNALQNAPAFTSDQFPDTSSSGWDQEFSTFWQSNGGTGSSGGSGTGSGGVTVATATP